MRKFSLKKVLFGLSISLVLAMAVGSFAIGETQTPVTPQEAEAQNAAGATFGPFTVDGGTQGTDFDYTSPVLTIHSGNLTISTTTQTTERIVVDGAATINLAGVNIDRTNEAEATAALEIADDALFNVTITLEDKSENTLKGKMGNWITTNFGSPGIQKNGDTNVGTLTITGSTGEDAGKLEATGGYNAAGIGGGKGKNASNITISGGNITATGGDSGAGIGGGYSGSVSNITITGGTVTATGGYGGAGIGGGYSGSVSNITITGGTVTATGGYGGAGIGGGGGGNGSNNSITGDNVVVIAQSGITTKAALEGFADSDRTGGIAFEKKSTDDWSGAMYGSVTITKDITFPGDLTVGGGGSAQTLTVDTGATLTLSRSSALTTGTQGTIDCKGKIKTAVGFKTDDGTEYDDITFTYMEANQPKTYGDTSPGLPGGKSWFDVGGTQVDASTAVLLNEHTLYTENASRSDLKVEGGAVYGVDYLYDGANNILEILTNKEMTIENKDRSQPTGWRIVIGSASGANLTLNNVNISTDQGAALRIPNNYPSDVNITLADGSENTLITTADYYAGLQKNGNSGVGTLTITGSTGENAGKLEATGAYFAAGIGGGSEESVSNITINGGTVTATGEQEGAGIGGGYKGSGSDITITGGTVAATGGASGAGIGGGRDGSGSNITISGGTVTATGGYAGAGIGGGMKDMSTDANGSHITITGGTVTANGSFGGAGIGGGRGGGQGTDITIDGGTVTAIGGIDEPVPGMYYVGSGIGGGHGGSGSKNTISGSAVVMAASCDTTVKPALEGFDTASEGKIEQSIVFTGVVIYDPSDLKPTGITYNDSKMYDNVTLSENLEIPIDLTVPSGQTLSIKEGKTVALTGKDNAKYIVEGTLQNNGTVTLPTNLEFGESGKVTTLLKYDKQGGSFSKDSDYQLYQDKAGKNKTYQELPQPATNSAFNGWFTKAAGAGNKIDDTTGVDLNLHQVYADMDYVVTFDSQGGSDVEGTTSKYKGKVTKPASDPTREDYKFNGWYKEAECINKWDFDEDTVQVDITLYAGWTYNPTPTPPTPTPPEPGPEPTPTPEPTPDPSVNPDGGDGSGSGNGSGSGASSKTGDPFMGGAALALLGVATTGAVLVRKRK